MLCNESTVLRGERVVLVPYRPEHVPTYVEWMKSPVLREQTASEELSLEEEYDMQQRWHLDQDKLTFIVLTYEHDVPANANVSTLLQACTMVGDVNAFLSECHDDDNGHAPPKTWAEFNIMIPETRWRRKGLATEALGLLIHYITSDPTPRPPGLDMHPCAAFPLSKTRLIARISHDNGPSHAFFEKHGFVRVKHIEYFGLTEYGVQDATRVVCVAPREVLAWP